MGEKLKVTMFMTFMLTLHTTKVVGFLLPATT